MAIRQDCWSKNKDGDAEAMDWLSKLNIGDKLLHPAANVKLNLGDPSGRGFEIVEIKHKTAQHVIVAYPNMTEHWDRKLPFKYAFAVRPIASSDISVVDIADTIPFLPPPSSHTNIRKQLKEKENSKTLSHYKIKSKLTLSKRLSPDEYIPPKKIYVKMLTDTIRYVKILTLYVDAEDTGTNIKAMIQDQEGIPQEKQRLVFLKNDFQNHQTLKTMRISNEMSLKLFIISESVITINVKDVLALLSDQKTKSRKITTYFKLTLNLITAQLGLKNCLCAIEWWAGKHLLPSYLYNVAINRIPEIQKHLRLTLLFDKLPPKETLLCIKYQLCSVHSNVHDTLSLINAAIDHSFGLISSIQKCKTFETLGKYNKLKHLFYGYYVNSSRVRPTEEHRMTVNSIPKFVEQAIHGYDVVDDMLSKTKAKFTQNLLQATLRREDIQKLNIIRSRKQLIAFQNKLHELDIETLKTWKSESVEIFQSIHEIYNKKEDELKQIYQIWTLDEYIAYLDYANNDKMEFNIETMDKFKLVGINGNTMSEISDSFLILAGINDPSKRKLIITATKDLLNKYGGYEAKHICCVCVTEEINTVCVPCGHMAYCNGCGKKSFEHTNKCPICRKDVITLVTTFKS